MRAAIALVGLAACARAPAPPPPPPPAPAPAPAPVPALSGAAPAIEPPASFETDAASFVVDAGVPAWLRERVTRDVAAVAAFYTSKLGALPGPKLAVHLSFGTQEHGKSLGGEARAGNLIVLRVELQPAVARAHDAATLLGVDELVAHEAGHLWAGPYASGENSPPWLHEGLPDAFALRAVRGTGAMSDTDYARALSEAASECAMWVVAPRRESRTPVPPPGRASYVCGSTVALAAESSFASARPGADLFAYWLAVKTPPFRKPWPLAFFAPVVFEAKKPNLAAALQLVADGGGGEGGDTLRGALIEAGLRVSDHATGPFPDDYEAHASIPAVEALLPLDCAAVLQFEGDSEVIPRVTRDGACPGLAKNDRIEALAGVPLGPKGATAWDAGYASCQSRHSVDVGVRGNTVSLPCDPAARPRPAYFDVQGAP